MVGGFGFSAAAPKRRGGGWHGNQLPVPSPRVTEIMGVQLVNRIPVVIPLLKEQVAIRINNAAQFWVNEAQNNANIDTGFMKAHIGQTTTAVPNSLSAEIRSLAPYSMFQDTGRNGGNLFWTRAYIATREKFRQFIYQGLAFTGSAGSGVIRAASQEFHGPLGRGGG